MAGQPPPGACLRDVALRGSAGSAPLLPGLLAPALLLGVALGAGAGLLLGVRRIRPLLHRQVPAPLPPRPAVHPALGRLLP